MRKIFLCFLFQIMLLSMAIGQPGTEIYLFDLKISKDKIKIYNPRNITSHPGYDNQPFFHPKKNLLYYASANPEGRTDILEYNYKTGSTRKLTQTSEREYSPTVTPDSKYLSCIIQRDSGQQDLGKYPIEGGAPIVIIDNLKVGYHAWVDEDNVFVFVLGEPNTLRWYSVSGKKDRVIAEDIGRSIHRIPGTKSISFIHKVSPTQWLIKKTDENGGTISTLGETLQGREFLTWTADQKILMSDDKKIFFMEPAKGSDWKEITIESTVPINTITRLAVNAKNNLLAVVVNE